MSLKSRADSRRVELSDKDKLEIYDNILTKCASILTTTYPFKVKKNVNRTRDKVNYRELPEWIQEFEKVFDSAPVDLYESKAELYRAMARMALYLTTLFFENDARTNSLPEKIKALSNTKHTQVMLQSIAREDMLTDIKERYENIRKTYISKKPKGLSDKLEEINKLEVVHSSMIKPIPEHDDIIDGIVLFNENRDKKSTRSRTRSDAV